MPTIYINWPGKDKGSAVNIQVLEPGRRLNEILVDLENGLTYKRVFGEPWVDY